MGDHARGIHAGSRPGDRFAVPYPRIANRFGSHEAVDHQAGEYSRGHVTTNQVESFFSQLKRSVDGTHHHVSREHLIHYLAEFDFRYSHRTVSGQSKMEMIVNRTRGRQLSYKPARRRSKAA